MGSREGGGGLGVEGEKRKLSEKLTKGESNFFFLLARSLPLSPSGSQSWSNHIPGF